MKNNSCSLAAERGHFSAISGSGCSSTLLKIVYTSTKARPSCSCIGWRPQLTSAGGVLVTKNKKPGGKSSVTVLVKPHLQGRTVSLTAFRAGDATMKLLACFEPPRLPSILYRTIPSPSWVPIFHGICRDL